MAMWICIQLLKTDAHLTGDQEAASLIPVWSGNTLSWRSVMKYFLQSFSPFRWFKKGICQFLVKECAEVLVNRLEHGKLTGSTLPLKVDWAIEPQLKPVKYCSAFQVNCYLYSHEIVSIYFSWDWGLEESEHRLLVFLFYLEFKALWLK